MQSESGSDPDGVGGVLMRGHNKDEDYIWIEVTQDEYRHIIKMADSARELAKQCGVSRETVVTTAWRYEKGTNKKGRFERVLL